jgi:mannitol-1-/sugar-/sorbitol-6-phosphatase
MPVPVQAVLFDLDGVLVDSKRVVERAWRRWASEAGVPADELIAIVHGRPARELVRMFAPALDAEAEAERVARYELADAAGVTLIPGAPECVELASRRRWAVVTSGSRALADDRLGASGLPVPDALVTADDVTAGKPDPQPYQRAAAALDVAIAGCVVVEDAPAGVLAGTRAGATVIAVTTTHSARALAGADHVLAGMEQVAELLRTMGLS